MYTELDENKAQRDPIKSQGDPIDGKTHKKTIVHNGS